MASLRAVAAAAAFAAVALAVQQGQDEGQAVLEAGLPAADARFRSALSVGGKVTKINGLQLQPAGSSKDPRDLKFDVEVGANRGVSVTVFHKGKNTKKLTGKLAIPEAQPLYLHQILVPPAVEADELQFTLTLNDVDIETGTFTTKKAKHATLALTVFPTAQQYQAMADALCPLTGRAKCGSVESFGNLMRVMYQQVAIDHFNNGDGSCRGGTFLSGALVLEDDADKKLFNTLMEVGTYRRASSHEVPGCTRSTMTGAKCQAFGVELGAENAFTVIAEPIVTSEQAQRVWRGENRDRNVQVADAGSVKTFKHTFFLPFTLGGKNFVFMKPESVGTLKGSKLTHLRNYLRSRSSGGSAISRQEGGSSKRFKKMRFFNAALAKHGLSALAAAGHYFVSDVLEEVRKKEDLQNKDVVLKALAMEVARDMGVTDCKYAEQLVQRESNFAYRNGNEIFFTAAEAQDLWSKAQQGINVATMQPSAICRADVPPPVQDEEEQQ